MNAKQNATARKAIVVKDLAPKSDVKGGGLSTSPLGVKKSELSLIIVVC